MNIRPFIKVDKAAFYRFIQNEPEGRYEYEWGRIVQQQAGVTFTHARIAAEFVALIRAQIDRRKWAILEARGVEMAETIRYPDVVVEPITDADSSFSTVVPSLIVEVLSPSSVDRDLFVKPVEYLALASLEAYIIASQDEVKCQVWVRGADREFLEVPEIIVGRDNSVDIPALSLSIPLEEIYRSLDLKPTASNS